MIATTGQLKKPAKQPKPAKVTSPSKPESDDQVLKKSLSYESKFLALSETGADDDTILVAIRERWRMALVGGGRSYAVVTDDPIFGAAIWFDTIKPTDEDPNLYYNPKTKDGYLVADVRRIFEIPEVNGAVAAKPEGKKKDSTHRAQKTQSSTEKGVVLADDPLATVEVIDEGNYPFTFFKRTSLNPRTSFDEDMIDKMAPSIQSICRMTPILCHEDGTIIDGETRHRAAEKAGKVAVYGKKIRCTAAQAAIIRLQTTLQRRDLNPIDRAVGMKSLQDEHGLTVDQVAKLVDMKRGDSVRNIIRLLELPFEWQQMLKNGELTAYAARILVPWQDEYEVLGYVKKELEKIKDRSEWSVALQGELDEAINQLGLPLKGYYYDRANSRSYEVNLKLTDEQRKELRVRTVKLFNRERELCFNRPRWFQLVEEAEKAKAAREAKRLEKQSGSTAKSEKIDPQKAKENAEKQLRIFQKKLYRFRVRWHQVMAAHKLINADADSLIGVLMFLSTRDGHYQRKALINSKDTSKVLTVSLKKSQQEKTEKIRQIAIEQATCPFDVATPIFEPKDIEDLAAHFEIDLQKDWPKSFGTGQPCEHLWDDFCGLWPKEQLIELLEEWAIGLPTNVLSLKRSELVDMLRRDKPVPSQIAKVKPVTLC